MPDHQEPISPQQLAGLGRCFVDAVRGSPGEVTEWLRSEQVGALTHLVVADGRLRPDWLGLARDVLDTAVETFAHGSSRFNRSVDARFVADTIRADWGLDAYPSKLRSQTVIRKTRASWREKLCSSELVREAVSARITALVGSCDGSCREGVDDTRFLWWLDPPRYWVGSDTDAWLIERGTALLGPHLEPGDDSPDLVRSILCVALSARLSEYFDGLQTDAVNYFRHLHQTLIPAWSRSLLLYGPAPDITGADKPTRGSEFASVTAAAVAMLASVVTAPYDRRQSLVAEYEHVRAARATSGVWPVIGHDDAIRTGSLLSMSLTDFSGVERLVRRDGLRFLLSRAAAASAALDAVEPRAGDDYLRLAWDIRNCSDPELKQRYLTRYVAARERIEAMPTTSDSLALNQADHLVGWDTVTSEVPKLGLRLALAMERQRTVGISGYRTHRYRSLAILANKHNNPAMADHLLNLGVAELSACGDLPETERLESAQQLYLAKAGVWIKQLEAYLREVPTEIRGLPQAERAAHQSLAFAGSAYKLLLRLAPELPLDPVAARQADHRIASVSWNVQTRIIRLRAALAAWTAVESGLCRDRAVHEGLDNTQDDLVADDDGVVLAWRELIARDELALGHQLDLCRIGLWLAFLRGLRLPLSMSASKAFASTLAFFDGDPAQIEQGQSEKLVDPGDAVIWLDLRRADAGWLSWADPRSAGEAALSRASAGAYHDWLIQEHCRCKVNHIERSYD